jgi:hypothetical protein
MGSFGRHGMRRRRQRVRCGLLLQQRRGWCGGRAEARNITRHDVWVFPPLQAECRGAGSEPLHAAAECHDGAGQFRPRRMPRADAVAAAHPGDRATERSADRCGLGLRRARREIRPMIRPCLQSAAATRTNSARVLQEKEDQHGDEMDQPLGQFSGFVPICIGEVVFGRKGEWVVHCGPDTTPRSEGVSSFISSLEDEYRYSRPMCRASGAGPAARQTGRPCSPMSQNTPAISPRPSRNNEPRPCSSGPCWPQPP